MAASSKRKEIVLELPTSLLNKLNGFSIDFGGSVIKVCYLSKEHWKSGESTEDKKETGKLNLISFSREDLDDAIEFLKNNCYIRRVDENDKPTMFTTGLGGFQYGAKFENELNVTTKNQSEGDAFKCTMDYLLDNVPVNEMSHLIQPEVKEAIMQGQLKMMKGIKESQEKGMTEMDVKDDVEETVKKEHDPMDIGDEYLVGVFGSAFGCMRSNRKGGFSLAGLISPLGGRSFLGLGSILTDAKTYEELMDLAEKGSNLNMDLTMVDVLAKTSDSKSNTTDDLYGFFSDNVPPQPIFLWGKCVGQSSDQYKKEDVARTLLNMICGNLVQVCLNNAVVSGIRHIFVAGSFISHPLTQKIVLAEFETQRCQMAGQVLNRDGNYHLHILNYGSHLGALGTFIMGARQEELEKK